MKLSILAGSTSQTVNVFVRDSSSTTGGGLTGLVFNTASLTAYYALPKAAAVSITLATQTVTGAYSSGGFVEISATNMPGWYRFDIPDAAIASGRFTDIHFKGATNMAPLPIEIELTGWNNQDAVRGGMTAMPNANAGAAGGLWILGANNTAAITIGAVAMGNLTASAIACTTITASGAVAFQSTFAVTGATTLTGAVSLGSTLGITGGVTLSSTLSVGNTTLNALTVTTNFLVSGTTTLTGNVSLGGTLGVTGTTTFAAVNTGAIGTGNITITGTLSTSGTVTFNAFTVTNATTLSGAVSLGSTLGITGAVTLSSTLAVGNVTLNGLAITNNLAVGGTFAVTGTTTLVLAAGTITAASIAPGAFVAAVWDGAISGHTTAGTFGSALNAAGSAGDPWATALPGGYGAGTAGFIVGTNLDDTISGVLTAIGALSIPTAIQNADTLLNRDMGAVTVTNSRSPINAFRFIRNGFTISGSTMSVLGEDDTTVVYTRDLTLDAAAVPITGVS